MDPKEDGQVALAPGTLLLEGDRIVGREPGVTRTADLGGPGFLVSPGFVDTHLHLPQFDSIGVAGLELLDWLTSVIFPAETRWADVAFARSMCERIGRQLVGVGTTAIAAYATSHTESTQVAIDTLGAMGFSGIVGQVLMDQFGPSELLVPADRAIAGCSSLAPKDRIDPAINPRFAVSCSMPLMKAAAQLARTAGWWLQTHLAETHAEIETVRRLHGAEYVAVYAEAGLLTNRTLLAHGVHLSDDDLSCLHAHRSVIAHCPTANRFLVAGSMNWDRTAASGIRVSLGTDVAGGPDRSMVRVARAMLENRVARRCLSGRDEPDSSGGSASRAWWQITRGNAETLGLRDIGHLAPGARADIVVIRPDLPAASAGDPLGPIVYAWDDRWIEAVLIAGRVFDPSVRT